MNAFAHHLGYDFKTGIRDRSKLLMFYLFPLVYFGLIGGLMATLNPGFKQLMLPSMVVFAYMCATLLTVPNTLVTARETGVFRSYRINGVPAGSIIGIPVISTGVHMVVVTAIVSVAGVRLFAGVPPASVVGFVLACLLSYAAYAGIGVLLGVAAGNTTVATLLSQLIYIPSIMLGGLMIPLSVLPSGLKTVAQILPATHCTRVFEAIAMPGASGGIPWASLSVLAASTVLDFCLAGLLFEWDSRTSVPSRKAWLALLAVVPYAVSMAIGA
jgi:ABC-2 type transport system permease protein